MGIGDSIADNGTYTMSNLKSATGIADDRLSAHHPNGAGNQTAFGDFYSKAVASFRSGATSQPDYNDRSTSEVKDTLLLSSYNGSSADASGSYNSNLYFVFDDGSIELSATNNDTFKIRIHFYKAGDYFGEQILKNGPGLSYDNGGLTNFLGYQLVTDGNGNTVAVDAYFEMIDFGGAVSIGFRWEDLLNLQGDFYGAPNPFGKTWKTDSGLIFRTQEVDAGTPLIEYTQVQVVDDGFSVTFDWNQDSNGNNIGEGAVVYDPGNQIDAVFKWYDSDPSASSPVKTSEEPDYSETVSDFSSSEGSRSITRYLEIEYQDGTEQDVVQIDVQESETGTWDSTKSCYSYTTSTSRNTGSVSNPYLMSYGGTC